MNHFKPAASGRYNKQNGSRKKGLLAESEGKGAAAAIFEKVPRSLLVGRREVVPRDADSLEANEQIG
jgi:hypothetical protein